MKAPERFFHRNRSPKPRGLHALLLVIVGVAGPLLGREIRDAGAIGDGKADDTAAIQGAVNSGGAWHFTDGVYRLTQSIEIDLAKTGYTALRGDGTARIVMAGAGPAFRVIGTHGGTADPKSVNPEVLTRERMPMVAGLEIVGDHEQADGIEAKGTLQLTITETRMSRLRHGVHLVERNRNLLISACHIYDNSGIGVFFDQVNLHQTNIVGTHISYCAGGGVVSRGGEVRNVQISGCDIEANMAPDLPPAANVELDSRGGSIAEVAIVGCTLQHTSHASGSANIRILGPGDQPKGKSQEDRNPREGNVTISANVFSDVRTNIEVQDARGVVITGNTFWEGFEHDLVVERSSDVIVAANNFDKPRSYEIWQKELPKQGLVFRDCQDCTLNGLHVHGVRQEAAILIERCDRFHISDCTILDSDGPGLLLRGVSRSRIHGCMIRDDREGVKPTQRILVVDGSEVQVSE